MHYFKLFANSSLVEILSLVVVECVLLFHSGVLVLCSLNLKIKIHIFKKKYKKSEITQKSKNISHVQSATRGFYSGIRAVSCQPAGIGAHLSVQHLSKLFPVV